MNLDLGSGPRVCDPEEYIGADLRHWTIEGPGSPSWTGSWDDVAPGEIVKVDLRQYPWPWPDDSVQFVWCAYFIPFQTPGEWIHFADELGRILEPGGRARIIWPNLRTGRAWQDPLFLDHVPLERWSYASRRWRTLVGLDMAQGYPTCDLEMTEFAWEGLHDDVATVPTPAQEVRDFVEGILADDVRWPNRVEELRSEWERLLAGSSVLAPIATRAEDAKQQQSAHWWDFAADCTITLRACCRVGEHAWTDKGTHRACSKCGTTRREGEPE